jgi:hypothetical protein
VPAPQAFHDLSPIEASWNPQLEPVSAEEVVPEASLAAALEDPWPANALQVEIEHDKPRTLAPKDTSWDSELEPVGAEEPVPDTLPALTPQKDLWPAEAWKAENQHEEAPAIEASPAEQVAGRVLVTIAPVPDFDRLLNLDSALSRMQGIASISLADYAREEVTFRLEMDSPMSAEDLARNLSESTGSSTSVATAEEGKLVLRLAS